MISIFKAKTHILSEPFQEQIKLARTGKPGEGHASAADVHLGEVRVVLDPAEAHGVEAAGHIVAAQSFHQTGE